jgi:muramoyltetrapeptide carboxypeptidase LdcA involved in peptidoglycan recycling
MVPPNAIPFQLALMDKLEELLLIAIDAEPAQQVKLLIQPQPTATLKDQLADATKLSIHLTNAKIANLTNLVTVDKLLATPFQLALTDKLEELLLIAIDAEPAQLVKLLTQLELTATLKDQLAHVTRL